MNIYEYLKQNREKFPVIVSCLLFYRKYKGVNWIKTLYLNFSTQKFRDAVKLPILAYGRLKIVSLAGKIKIESPITTGMIRLGINSDISSATKGTSLLLIRGILVFKGRFVASINYSIFVDYNAILSIGDLCFLGGNSKIHCLKKITLGKGARSSYESQIFDTSFHYVRDIQTGKIPDRSKEVNIGNFCWIGNRTTIMKGACLPDHSIVASNSLCNRDYTTEDHIAPLIGGIPAKIIKTNSSRVFSLVKEKEIIAFFRNNPEADFYQGDTGIIDESEDCEYVITHPYQP
jgi:acetyltransferase-like isoleucine patch superfamily enzyme